MRAPNHLNALRAFEAAARHLSFASAAEELNVTPAAVGQLVRRLEEVLGIELFRRSPAGPARLVLTEAAEAALPDLQAGFDRLAAAMERLKSSGARRTLSVTLPPDFADKWLLVRLDQFNARHPEQALRIDTSGRLVDFAAEQVDLGVRYGTGSWPGLASRPLLRDRFFPVCSPALLTGAYPLRGPEDLRHHMLIHDTSWSTQPLFPTWRDWFAEAGLPMAESARGPQVNNSASALRMALAGNGVALARTSLVGQELASGLLVRPFGPVLDSVLGYHIICRPQDEADPAIAAFRDWLLAAVAADPQLELRL